MPELPEVQTVVDTLAPGVAGRRLDAVIVSRPDYVKGALPSAGGLSSGCVGRRVSTIVRRAKRIVFELEGDDRFFVHLGMTGRLVLTRPDEPPVPHTHVRWLLETGMEIRLSDPRRFGNVTWLGRSRADAGLGPEPLTLRPADLARRLARTRRALKVALLDQRLIAGLGNIYVDEAVHAAGLDPLARCDTLSRTEVGRLNRAIKTVLRRAIRHGGSTLRDYVDGNGSAGSFQRLHRVYDRAGEPCRTCRTPIERFVLAARSTHWCPRCQGAGESVVSGSLAA
jgi:formamidopyrimidine-DNA glycosylase